MGTYKIVRIYFSDYRSNRTLRKGLTLEEAKDHCNDPETSSSTCRKYVNIKRTERLGKWFDSYTVE